MNTRTLFLLVVFVATLGAQGTITSTAPSSVLSGAATFLMVVNGSGFTSANIVQWDGANLTTAFASGTQLAASVTASLVTSAGTHNIRVKQSASVNVFSNTVTFTVNNPLPTITSFGPSFVSVGSGPVTLDVTGTGFRAATIVKVGGVNVATTFVSDTHVQGALPASMTANAASLTVQVVNPTPGGGTATSAAIFLVMNPVPTLGSISPAFITAGIPGLTLTANGTNYNSSTVVLFDNLALTTTLVNSTQVTAQVSAIQVATGATHTIKVTEPTPGGGTTAGQTFTVNNAVPTLASISPASTPAGVAFTLNATGTGYNPSTVIKLDGSAVTTTFISSTLVLAPITAAVIPAGGTHTVTISNPVPAGGTTGGQTLTVDNPVPTLSSTNPSAVLAGTSNFTLTATGTNYNPSSVLTVDGSPLTTTFISPTQVSATIQAPVVATALNHTIRVSNPSPAGGLSGGLLLLVTNPVPTATSISPATVTAGSADFTLTATGTGCVGVTTITLDAAPLTTTFLGSTQVSATVPAAIIASAGTHAIRISNPIPGGGNSAAQTLTVQNPLPSVGSLSPILVLVGSPSTLTVNGSGFNASSVVRNSGAPLATTFVSASQLTAVITPLVTGIGALDVSNPAPGGGASNSLPLTMNNPVPVVSSLSPASALVNDPPPPFTVNGSGFVSGSQILFNGSSVPTTFVSSSALTATVPAGAMNPASVRQVSVVNQGPGGGTSGSVAFTIGNLVPVISSIFPAQLAVGTGGTNGATVALTGSGFMSSSTVDVVGQGPMPTTFVSALEVDAVLPMALLANPAQLQLRVTNPGPGGGTTLAPLLPVFNAIPSVSSAVATSPPFIVSNGGSILVTGTGFHALSEVRIDTVPVSTSFSGTFGTGSLTASVPANLLIAGTHQLTVFNGGNGGGESAPVPFVFQNPAPVITSLSAFSAPGGGNDVILTMTGTNFLFSTTADASGTNIAAIPQSSTQMTLFFPQTLQRAVRTFTITVRNPGPGGGSASIPFFVDGPFISSCAPAVVPVTPTGSPPITLTVGGAFFQAGDQVRMNGFILPTTLVDTFTLTGSLDTAFPVLHQPGGFAVTVTRQGSADLVSSNAFGAAVGTPGTPDNSGTVILAPAPPTPGQGFNLRVELPVASGPVTLLAQVPAPATVMLNVAPGFDLVVGPGLNAPIVLADGLGIFGPSTPTFVAPYDLSSFGIPAGHGIFEIRDIGAPPVQIGITFSLAAVYVDPSSPIGVNATHVSGTYSL